MQAPVYRDDVETFEADKGPQGPGLKGWRNLPRRSRGLSLRTLIILRWMAIAGQSATIVVATAGFHFDLPLWPCLTVIAASVVMNLHATRRLKRPDPPLADGGLTAAHLGFDILQLTVLLGLTGGLQNPFCLLLVAPVTVAAASLPGRQALALGLLVLLATAGLFFWAMPLPWQAGTELTLPALYRFGIGLALVTGVVFTAAYAWRVAADAEKLELAKRAADEKRRWKVKHFTETGKPDLWLTGQLQALADGDGVRAESRVFTMATQSVLALLPPSSAAPTIIMTLAVVSPAAMRSWKACISTCRPSSSPVSPLPSVSCR